MAIVGTAFVRLKVIGDKLSGDIKKAVEKSVSDSAPGVDRAGSDIGGQLADSVADGLSGNASPLNNIADSVGEQIGRRMAENMGRSLRKRATTSITGAFTGVRAKVSGIGDELGEAFSTFSTSIKKQAKKINLGGILISGLAFAVTALPSILSGAGAVIGAYAASAVSAISALGPAAAGAALVGVAAFSSLKISAGLFKLAMDTTTPALEDFQSRMEAFKGQIAAPIQSGLLPYLNAGLRLATPLITALQGQFYTFGTTVGNVIASIAEMVASSANISRIGSIMDTNNAFIAQAGIGVQGLVQGFIILLNALKPVFDTFGPLIAQMGTWVANTLAAKEASGELATFITNSLAALQRFGGIVRDLGIGIYNIFVAANPAGASLLTSLEGIAARFREWTGDEANQTRMTTFFNNMRTIIGQVNDILGQLVGSGLRALEGTDLTALGAGLETLRSLGPPIAQMFNAIKDAAGPALQTAFQNFADIITSLANSGVIGILAGAFSNLLAIISTVLALPGVGTILSFVAGLAVMLKTVTLLTSALGLLGPAFTLIRTIATILVGAFGIVPVVIAAVVAALAYFFTQTETGRAIVARVWEFIKNAISTAINGIITAFNAVVAALGVARDFIVGVAQAIWSGISTAFNAVLTTVQSVWATIVAAVTTAVNAVSTVVTTVIGAIAAFVTPILTTIGAIFSSVFNAIRTVVETVLGILYEIWIRIFPILLIPLRIFEGLVILAWQAISDFISAAVTFISNIVTTVWNAIYAFLSTIITAIWTFIVAIWTAIQNAISTALNAISAVVSAVWNAIYGVISSVLSAIGNFVSSIWNAIVSTVSGALSAVFSVVSSVWNNVYSAISGVLGRVSSIISSTWNSVVSTITGAVNSAYSIISSVFNNIVSFVTRTAQSIAGIVGGIWDGLGDIGSDIIGGLRGAVNGIIGAVNTVIGGINTVINGANALPGVDIPNVPRIPALAKGGVVSPSAGGTLALIAEAGKRERVEPLDSDGLSKRDKVIINRFTQGGAGGGATQVRVFIGDRELTDMIAVEVEDQTSSIGDALLTGRKD